MSRKTLSPASVFERVLRAHETGGVTFKDVRAQLKELLAAGASPVELLETLRRQEQWEPLPESARVEVVGLIDEAIRTAPKNDDSVAAAPATGEPTTPAASANIGADLPLDEPGPAGDLSQSARMRWPAPSENVRSLEARIAGQQADYTTLTRSYERAREAESTANTRAAALAAQVSALEASRDVDHAKARQSAVTLAETIAANEALHARAESAVREASDARREIRELGESVRTRDAALVEAQQSLRVSAGELTALQQQGVQSAALLAAEQAKSHHATQAIAELQQAAKQREAEVVELRESVSARDAALAATQNSMNARVKELDVLLQEARSTLADAQRSAVERDAGRDNEVQELRAALVAERAKSQHASQSAEQTQKAINGLRGALSARDAAFEALQSDLQASRSALAESQRSGNELNAGREAERDAELQALRAALIAEKTKSQLAKQSAEQSEKDSQGLRDVLSARDASLAEAQRALSTRTAELEALQSDLQAGRDNEVQELRAALVAEQAKSQQAARSMEQFQADIRSLRDSLSARDVSLAEAQRALSARAAGLEALQSDLQAARSALAESQGFISGRDALTQQSERDPNIGAARVASPSRVGVIAAIGVILLCAVAAYFMYHRGQPSARAPVAVSVAPVLPKAGTVIRDCLTCPEITVLPTGMFNQGSAGPGVGPAAFEKPLHAVTISSAIGMATNLVTVDEFQQFITASGWQSQGCTTYDGEWKARPKSNWSNPGFTQTGKHPVTCASWNDAQAYAKWLSAKAGHTYRLPSASEWEYAARTGSEAVVPWTTEPAACANANVADNSAARRYPGWAAFNCDDGYVYTSPVGSFKANAFGLNDMLGNVFQWTEDCWHPDYVGAPSDGTARTDGPCDEHELRGGSWFTTPAYVRANYRNHFTADYRSSTVGIRLVRDLGA